MGSNGGKITGGIIGLCIGGPFGAVVGAVVGSLFDGDDNSSGTTSTTPRQYSNSSTSTTSRQYSNSSTSTTSRQYSNSSTSTTPKQYSNTSVNGQNDSKENYFYTKVVGVTFDNHQNIVRTLRTGESLTLIREKDNKFDSNAVAVYTSQGQMFGHLSREMAAEIGPKMDLGWTYNVEVAQVTGGGDLSYGVNIKVTSSKPVYSRTIDDNDNDNEDDYYEDKDDSSYDETHPDACCGYDH